MKLLMISGDRAMLEGKKGAFWNTLEAFSKEWERIDVICPRPAAGPFAGRTQTFFGNVHFHPSAKSLWHQAQWIQWKGQELIEKYHHDVMTVHEYPPFFNGIGAKRLSKITGVPYVLEVHHLVGYPVAVSWQERVGRILSRMYLPRAINKSGGVRVVSKVTAEQLMKWGVRQRKISVVPSFYLDRALIESLGPRPPVRCDVVFCGRLVPNKGIPDILRAIAKLPRATLLIIGDGPERQKLQSLSVSLKIANRVEFRGWLPAQREVLQGVRSARVLVMNSSSEGGPRVPLEAMAAGMPVIVTRVGVMPDVIVDGVNGLFTTGTPEDLAKVIERALADNNLRERMGNEAKAILDRFEREKLIARYAVFLKSVAGSV
jgi:glycosyltransferase involved in cell wall biosynthesis